MLIEFSAENFRSIREAVTLSMVASKGRDLPETCTVCPGARDVRVLKCAAIYGANASGKSNFLAAFRCMLDFVRLSEGHGSAESKPRTTPFQLDPDSKNEPSRFEIIFVSGEIRYTYGFSARFGSIHSEWLYAYPKGRRRMVFEREAANNGQNGRIRFGTDWSGDAKIAARKVGADRLILGMTDGGSGECVANARRWLTENARHISAFPDFTGELDATAQLACIDPEARQRLVDFLRLADLGITDFNVEEIPDENGKKENGPRVRGRIKLVHEGLTAQGEPTEISLESFDEESSGTQKFFALAGPWFLTLSRGGVLMVDELELRLHPLLTRRLIELFYGEQSNPKCAQLIFTTHDSSLLNAELFRRDQIWFAEKTPEGATSLYSLADFRPKRGENIRAGYLEGRYGAIPFVGDLP